MMTVTYIYISFSICLYKCLERLSRSVTFSPLALFLVCHIFFFSSSYHLLRLFCHYPFSTTVCERDLKIGHFTNKKYSFHVRKQRTLIRVLRSTCRNHIPELRILAPATFTSNKVVSFCGEKGELLFQL